jgi:hypothetical protein
LLLTGGLLAALGFTMAAHETTMSLPPRWGDDRLSAFVDQAFKNSLASFVQKHGRFAVLDRVDQNFLRIGENLINPPDFFGAFLLLRAHSAFRAACRLAMSGQVPDTFPVLRACLEYSLYALHINTTLALGEVWLRRHDDAASLSRVRQEFTNTAVKATLRNRDPHLYPIVDQLYERCIDFGGHPNERAITGSMTIERQPGRVEFQQIYLHGDSLSLDHGLKTTAQVGLGSLCIFQHIFLERFRLLGIQDMVDQLRREL